MMCDTPYPSIRDPAPTRRSWLSGLFNRTNRARTVSILVEAQNHDDGNQRREMLRAKISAAETKLTRHRSAIEAGVDPLALVEAINVFR